MLIISGQCELLFFTGNVLGVTLCLHPPPPESAMQSTPNSAIFLLFSAAELVLEKHAPSDRTCHFEHVTFHCMHVDIFRPSVKFRKLYENNEA